MDVRFKRGSTPGWYSRFSEVETGVACPSCEKGALVSRFSCFTANFFCPACNATHLLENLAPIMNDEDFNKLAELVADRFSDRV